MKRTSFQGLGLLLLAQIGGSSAAVLSDEKYQGTLNITVDLDYSVYQGVDNSTTGVITWRGIRYAAPPVGSSRWQAPRPPGTNRTGVIAADAFGPVCPQQYPAVPGAAFAPGDEDCLSLNVYSPSRRRGASGGPAAATPSPLLPVVVYIHGGGYGLGDGRLDMTGFVNSNGNGLVGVAIQYRLGAFGFLSAAEVKARGSLNAGLLDQEFALQWIQRHIAKFGGDPDRVTIYGESAGGGSVMVHAVARGGKLGTSLFRNLIASSPYLPTQPYYDDPTPTEYYKLFASYVGCSGPGDVFDCLVSRGTQALQLANHNITAGNDVPYANWAFIPVTDGEYLTGPTSALLAGKNVNGKNLLAGSNANEGDLFVPLNITTQESLIQWFKGNFANLSDQNVTAVLEAYPSVPGPDDPSSPRFETNGYGPATAVNVSQAATGHQQRAYNIYAESTFVCPAYWLADAFSGDAKGSHKGYYYQYSVPFAGHGADIRAAFATPLMTQGPEFVLAFRKMYGNFVITGNPSIDNLLANGPSSPDPKRPNPASDWPAWTAERRAGSSSSPNGKPTGFGMPLLNLNQTGGTPVRSQRAGVEITEFAQPSLVNDFALADAYTWEGGRGRRCNFWRDISRFVPQR